MAQPLVPRDQFETQNRVLSDSVHATSQGFQANTAPAQSGFGTRQSRIPNNRLATTPRKMMKWLVPEMPIVEMYVNAQQIQYQYSKQITEQRTKGGWVTQYWGENIIGLSISGTTGTSGIEGINVLYDVYRNEQLMYDPYALALQAEQDRIAQSDTNFDLFGGDLSLGSLVGGGSFGSIIGSAGSLLSPPVGSPTATRTRPTLASLAFTVELYWSGEVYRGFFKDFNVTESAQNLGMFDYSINFRATQKRGMRQNYLPWHRSAVNGPSNSNPIYGTPHSFGALSNGPVTPGRNSVDQPNLNSPFADIGNSVVSAIEPIGRNIISAFDI